MTISTPVQALTDDRGALVAVAMNVLFTLAMLAIVQARITLDALAGLILSIGMCVDANILIHERMREEAERGASLRVAIKNGYVQDDLASGCRLPDVHHRVADLDGEVELGGGEDLGAVLVAELDVAQVLLGVLHDLLVAANFLDGGLGLLDGSSGYVEHAAPPASACRRSSILLDGLLLLLLLLLL